MIRFSLLGVILIGAIAVLLGDQGPVYAQDDKIFGAKGTPTNGTIVRMNKQEVVIEADGEKTFGIDEIRKVEFADDPDELRSARDLVKAGRYNDAVAALQKINRTAVKLDFIKQDITFYFALCAAKLALSGEFDSARAATAVTNFVDNPENANNYHFYEATEALADVQYSLGEFDKAGQRYSTLRSAPGVYKVRSMVRIADCQLAQGNYADAQQTFDKIISADLKTFENGPQQQLYAKIGKAVCLASTGGPDQGISLVEGIIRDNDPNDPKNNALFGRAYNALGACYRAAKKPDDALLAYLHTDVMFFKDADAHAEALYYLSDLWLNAAKNSGRAVKAKGLLKGYYGGSLWAQKQ